MVYIARRTAPNPTPKLSTDPGYDPMEERHPQILFSDWTPRNAGPHEENVEVYSNCQQVELFLNDKTVGVQSKPADDSPRNWKVPFEAGTLKAVGKNLGRVVASYELRTAGKPAQISLAVDRNAIAPVWDDVAYVTVTVLDENGVLVPTAGDLITFSIKGPGVIAAVDSGNNNSHESFQTNQRLAYQGSCFAMLKATGRKGQIRLAAAAPGLKSSSIIINAR